MRVCFSGVLQWLMENNLQKYEVSFIHEKHRHTAWVLLDPQTIPTLDKAFAAALPQTIGSVINLCFMQVSDDSAGSSAGHLVETIREAGGFDDIDWTKAEELAEKLDATVADPDSKHIIVEFIWECGGWDDNIFTQGFIGVPGSSLVSEFVQELERIGEESGEFYDFTSFDPSEGHVDDIGIEGLLEAAYEVGDKILIDFVKAVQAADYRTKLNDIASARPATPSPRVRM